MLTRQEIKAKAKIAVSQQRGTAILLPVIVFLVGLGGSAIGIIPVIGWLVSLVVSLILLVLEVGLCGCFVKIYKEERTDLAEPFNGLSVNFLRKLGSYLLMMLFAFLWSLLLFIPGIIKMYAYILTPYILATCPNVKAVDAITLSRRMMVGNKMKVFVMHLSFIGWFLLGILTLGILLLLYVAPYFSATSAGFFEEIKNEALANGVVTEEELYGSDPVEARIQ
jgi:uncharacterized membrane protein